VPQREEKPDIHSTNVCIPFVRSRAHQSKKLLDSVLYQKKKTERLMQFCTTRRKPEIQTQSSSISPKD
jgi:hypothetical protein